MVYNTRSTFKPQYLQSTGANTRSLIRKRSARVRQPSLTPSLKHGHLETMIPSTLSPINKTSPRVRGHSLTSFFHAKKSESLPLIVPPMQAVVKVVEEIKHTFAISHGKHWRLQVETLKPNEEYKLVLMKIGIEKRLVIRVGALTSGNSGVVFVGATHVSKRSSQDLFPVHILTDESFKSTIEKCVCNWVHLFLQSREIVWSPLHGNREFLETFLKSGLKGKPWLMMSVEEKIWSGGSFPLENIKIKGGGESLENPFVIFKWVTFYFVRVKNTEDDIDNHFLIIWKEGYHDVHHMEGFVRIVNHWGQFAEDDMEDYKVQFFSLDVSNDKKGPFCLAAAALEKQFFYYC